MDAYCCCGKKDKEGIGYQSYKQRTREDRGGDSEMEGRNMEIPSI